MSKQKPSNHLAQASSPYLLQHAHNPVNWYPWGEEALEKARKENKLLIISIGYAACHWCHVMEKESFSDPEVAAVMNQKFINIKVDREERPDVDQVYMDALQLMTGSGGWPLNIVALPDQRPVFGGTYFPKNEWVDVLSKISRMYENDADQFEEYAHKMIRALNAMENPEGLGEKITVTRDELHSFYSNLMNASDAETGGLQGAPKFPLPVVSESYLYYYFLTGNDVALQLTCLTLDQMAAGGIYDQAGGGFARYSTDEQWIVPHFEKMLYDNAQLIGVYANAWRLTRHPRYAEVIRETVAFLDREMQDESGGFHSALDADSEGEEGLFYVWDKETFDKTLGDDAEWAATFLGLEGKGYWEAGKNILIRARNPYDFIKEKGWTESDFNAKLRNVLNKLFHERKKRPRPALDDKILTSWNAMLISALVSAYKALGDDAFRENALQISGFIQDKMIHNDILYHTYRQGKATVPGFLEDYAFWIRALCDMYELTYDTAFLSEAENWMNTAISRFRNGKSFLFYFTPSDQRELISRKKETTDNVIPASNSVMACNLVRLAHWLNREEWKDDAARMLQEVKPRVFRTPAFHAQWGQLMCMLAGPYFELAAGGENARKLLSEAEQNYLPNKVSAIAEKNAVEKIPFLTGKQEVAGDKLYLCENKTCNEPAPNAGRILEQVRERLEKWNDKR